MALAVILPRQSQRGRAVATDPFTNCLAVTLLEEGGFSDLPDDPGGATNDGVTLAMWQSWVGHPVTISDMHALSPAVVAPFYRATFWQALMCDKLGAGIDLCVFDWGVNGGPASPARALQIIVGVIVDGHIGPATAMNTAVYARTHGAAVLVNAMQDARAAFYRGLTRFPTFGKGWLARTERIRVKALTMAGS